ncbi:hypothetical protein [Sphingobacterium corticibacterium]|uniref:Uncharacterized protein n=1 Tax=Sphingobacterium corticibacterium TaxID=2484746 RepID=A0A4Q6XL94_9SPHI|nr:hypothetical protein [Sphingobacterium corticibacterium]RZF60235.1 hypothetical protein EWE74_14100 [Sphingobacterium corticibacterium]
MLRSRGNILWNAPVAVIPGDSAIVRVPTADFPKGILSLAVFDGNNRPWAERLFMNKEQDDYRVGISTDQQGYGTKKKVTVTVRVTDAAGNPAVANLSVTATERNRRDSTAFRSIRQQAYYAGFARPLRQRFYAAGSDMPDGLLLGRLWQYSKWGSICVYTPSNASVYVPDRGGTTGAVVAPRQFPKLLLFEPTKQNVKAKEVDLRSLRGFNLGKIDAGPVFRTMTVEVDPESGTFFVPDSLLLSRQGQEWEIKIPAIHNASWRFHYLVEWQDPDIGFDSTVVRGGHLRLPKAMNSFAIVKSPTTSAFDFRGINRLEEIVIGRKEKVVKRTLKKTKCEEYEDIIREHSYSFHGKHVMKLVKGWTHPWASTPYGEPRTVMYLGCGRYRDINYIRNITIPEEFPLLDYETYPTTELDMRSTVYWNPNIVTDRDGTATFSFFTSDVTGDFEIVAQGLDVNTLAPLVGTGHFKVIIK